MSWGVVEIPLLENKKIEASQFQLFKFSKSQRLTVWKIQIKNEFPKQTHSWIAHFQIFNLWDSPNHMFWKWTGNFLGILKSILVSPKSRIIGGSHGHVRQVREPWKWGIRVFLKWILNVSSPKWSRIIIRRFLVILRRFLLFLFFSSKWQINDSWWIPIFLKWFLELREFH